MYRYKIGKAFLVDRSAHFKILKLRTLWEFTSPNQPWLLIDVSLLRLTGPHYIHINPFSYRGQLSIPYRPLYLRLTYNRLTFLYLAFSCRRHLVARPNPPVLAGTRNPNTEQLMKRALCRSLFIP